MINQKGVNLAELLHCVCVSHVYSCTTGFSMARVTCSIFSQSVRKVLIKLFYWLCLMKAKLVCFCGYI